MKYKIISPLGTVLATFSLRAFAERYVWQVSQMGINAQIMEN
jgi:hypothetical protein